MLHPLHMQGHQEQPFKSSLSSAYKDSLVCINKSARGNLITGRREVTEAGADSPLHPSGSHSRLACPV